MAETVLTEFLVALFTNKEALAVFHDPVARAVIVDASPLSPEQKVIFKALTENELRLQIGNNQGGGGTPSPGGALDPGTLAADAANKAEP
jgi:hypothetical protein